jgi:hypothetical protein
MDSSGAISLDETEKQPDASLRRRNARNQAEAGGFPGGINSMPIIAPERPPGGGCYGSVQAEGDEKQTGRPKT